jgi:hypothetical protein
MADHAVLVWSWRKCSFASRWPLPIKPIWTELGDPPIDSDDRVSRAIEAQLCGVIPTHRAIGTRPGIEALLCVEHTEHARTCPDCAPLIARLDAVDAVDA